MEKIIHSAIKFKWNGYWHTLGGKRHADIYEKLHILKIKPEDGSIIEGFMTSNWKFVNRIEAWKIADSANQLYDLNLNNQTKALYSEDIWPDD